jgi:hypothetical protein
MKCCGAAPTTTGEPRAATNALVPPEEEGMYIVGEAVGAVVAVAVTMMLARPPWCTLLPLLMLPCGL